MAVLKTQLFVAIDNSTLGARARDQIRRRIIDGRLPPSTQIAETTLASQLGISRTPLHEAMVMLSREGLVTPLRRKGWLVTALTADGARELYPVLARLAALALETAGPGALGLAGSLLELLASATGGVARLEAERQAHELLSQSCPNATLAELLESFTLRALRYELACADGDGAPLVSELDAVVDCLARHHLTGACKLIEAHWRDRGDDVVRRLSRRRPVESV